MFWRKPSHSNQETESAEKDAKVRDLRAALEPLNGRSLNFCNNACIRRYLEARNWDVEQAKKMLEETLKWRSTFKPEEIRWHEVAHEGETGKASIANFHDRQGRTVIIMRPGKQVVKYFVDPKTSQNIKFVYPNNQDSMELMKTFFDSENLPREFGGKTTLRYDHEEFSRLMTQEDVKTAKFWGFDDAHCHNANEQLNNIDPVN